MAKTHATGLVQGSNFSNEFDTLELYNNCRQEPYETTVAYVERFQRLWNLANEYGNEIDEAKASLRFFMKLDDNQFGGMKDQKMNQWRESPGEKITQLVPMIALASNWVSNGAIPEVIKPIPHPRGAYVQGAAGFRKQGAGNRGNSVDVGRQVPNGTGNQDNLFRNVSRSDNYPTGARKMKTGRGAGKSGGRGNLPIGRGYSKGSNPNIVCWRCGKKGHNAANCRAPAPASGSTEGQSSSDDWKTTKSYQGVVQRLDQKQDSNLDSDMLWGGDVSKRWQGIAHQFECKPYHVYSEYDSDDEDWTDVPIQNAASEVSEVDLICVGAVEQRDLFGESMYLSHSDGCDSGVTWNKICGTNHIQIMLGDQVFYHGPVFGCVDNDDRKKLIKCLQIQYPIIYDT